VGCLVGHLVHGALAVAHQARGPWQGQRATLSFVEESGGKARLHEMPRPFRQGALQAQQEAAVARGRGRHAIAIGHQAALVAPQVQERIPG
jgi:hypothetical protein